MRRFVSPVRLALALVSAACSGAAPALAYAHLSLAGHPGYAEICTVRGPARVPPDPLPGGDNRLAGSVSHCVLCLVSGGGHALVGSAELPRAPSGVERPAGFAPATRASAEPVRSAQPRGPPASHRFA
jgi:hypothetical protein